MPTRRAALPVVVTAPLLLLAACATEDRTAHAEAIGQCFMMDGAGWTHPEGPITKITKDPRHGRDVYFAPGPAGAELYLQPGSGRIVPCPDSSRVRADSSRSGTAAAQ